MNLSSEPAGEGQVTLIRLGKLGGCILSKKSRAAKILRRGSGGVGSLDARREGYREGCEVREMLLRLCVNRACMGGDSRGEAGTERSAQQQQQQQQQRQHDSSLCQQVALYP